MNACDLMTADVFSARADEPISEVRARMSENRIHCLPVLSVRGKLRGIVTSTDLIRRLPKRTLVSEVMSENVLSVPRETDLRTVAGLMADRAMHHVVVMSKTKVEGVLSSFDVLRAVQQGRLVEAPRHEPHQVGAMSE